MILFMIAAAAAVSTPVETPEALRAEAYVTVQNAMLSEAGDALTKVAARFDRGDDAIAPLERAREGSVQALAATDKRLIELLGSTSADAQTEGTKLAIDRDRLRAAIADLDRRIEELDPAYAELTRPRPLDLRETQALLAADEGLLVILPTEEATYSFAVTREGAAWNRAELSGKQVDASVAALRGSMISDLETGSRTFDRMRAFTLYDRLIRPVEAKLAGKRAVMTVVGGSLGTLPLQLLVTEKPADTRTDDAAMRQTHWLVDRYSLSTLPAVSSLRALRCLLVPANQRAAGCGPQKARDIKAGIATAPHPVEVVGFGAPLLAPSAEGQRGGKLPQASAVYRGGLVNAQILRSLPSLPGAKAELDMVSKLFGAGNADIETGADATETRVKRSTALSGARFIIFSTHGLLASESRFVGASEPGLVFTPPPDGTGTELDDGLLTASEAAKLKLGADLVVLSACNTAASDGTPGSGGLSGLARSFFFAGAHALVVSNWSVSDEATSLLVGKVFAAGRASGRTRFADVLRQADQSVRATPGFAAPAFWAPFVLVGTTD